MTYDAGVIGERIAAVRARIDAARVRAGRSDAVELVAVSKFHPLEALRAAYAAGHRTFGENYVQELVDKAERLRDLDDAHFHLLGHLQRNKVQRVVPWVDTVQTVDSSRLVEALAKRASPSAPLGVFVQVNVAREAQKSGCAPEELDALVAAVRAEESLSLRGLMTIPPLGHAPAASRPHFVALRALGERHGLRELSMGMSDDFEIAVEEGATLVRIGTAIFGARA